MDFCGNDTLLLLFKKVCRYYVEKYPDIIEYEISAYREMYEQIKIF